LKISLIKDKKSDMKRLVLMIIPALFFGVIFTSCSNVNETELTGGLLLKMGDNSVVRTSDIDYYDVSQHTIYLKKTVPYLKNVHGTVSVYAGNDEIYECSIHSGLCSHIPMGQPYIYDITSNEEKISIFFNPTYEQQTDPRGDIRFIAALKTHNLYHNGLHIEIKSVNISNGKVDLNLDLTNPDTFDYYYLDPDKMGFGLFHYFTNGPTFIDDPYTNHFTHQETVIHPEPWNSWEKEWLSLIKSGERKEISISYHHFDEMPAGKYKMSFCFPGLNISQKDRVFENGRIFMGGICTYKEVSVD
jgi:hypothetical protein